VSGPGPTQATPSRPPRATNTPPRKCRVLRAAMRAACLLSRRAPALARANVKASPILAQGARHAVFAPALARSKITTGYVGLEVEPDAKPILLDLYAKTLEALEAVPPSAEYRKMVEGMTKERLAVVEKTDDLRAIEATIGSGQVEQLIEQAKDELSLIPMLVEADAFSPYDGPLSSEEILSDLKRRGWALQRDDIPMRPSQDFPIEKEIELELPAVRGAQPACPPLSALYTACAACSLQP
jgi:NADH dehydrogenase (ubiquinone) 1 alpha subcomplex subunit 5